MKKRIYFDVLYDPMSSIDALRIIINISVAKVNILLIIEISNYFRNTTLKNPQEHVFLSLPYLYLKWFGRKYPHHTLSYQQTKDICNQAIK